MDNNNHGKWKLLFDSEIGDLGGDVIFKGNLNQNDLAKFIHISDAFTTEILKIWSEISYNITFTAQLLSLPLWQNSLVRIGNKPIYYKSWSSKGIKNVRHLMKFPDALKCFSEDIPGGGGGTSYNGLYGEAPPKGVPFSRFRHVKG